MERKSVVITGTSSGIGRAAVEYFSEKGWNVAATMRNTDNEELLDKLPGVKLFNLDVLCNSSIEEAISRIVKTFGGIDVLVNNAGYAVIGPFEAADESQIIQQYSTNVIGLMRVIRIVLPLFREQNRGVIINNTSVAGRLSFPLFSLYNSTKWAVEGFSESLQYELRPFNIKVKLVEPGPIKTDFYTRSLVKLKKEGLNEYDQYTDIVSKKLIKAGSMGISPKVVAKKIYKAAVSKSNRLRYPADIGARGILFLRKVLPQSLFFASIRLFVESKKW